jgi:hypothetical protein
MGKLIAASLTYCLLVLSLVTLTGCEQCGVAATTNPQTIDANAASFKAGQPVESRIRLTKPTTFFISPTGKDDADGLTAEHPWHTMQHAYDIVSQNYDLAGFTATIQLANGTYTEENGKRINAVVCEGQIPGQVGPVRFIGNPNHPENVVISVTANNIFEVIYTWAHIEGMTLTGTGSTVGMLSYFDARVTFSHVNFGPMGTGIHMSAFGGIIMAYGDYGITGGAGYHLLSNTPGSRIHLDGKNVTISGDPKFSAAFAVAENGGMISVNGNKFKGTGATGARYISRNNGIISSSGDANYFPGDAAGSVATGGIYGL